MGYNNNFGGMNLIWWAVWMGLLFWIFVTPYNIPGQRIAKTSALDILRRRFTSGQITNEEYREKKEILENDLVK